MSQAAALRSPAVTTLRDVVELGISHPCSAFDRWPGLTVLGPDGEPTAFWRTEFR